MGYNLLMNRVYWGYNPLMLTFDPNFQRDIQDMAFWVSFSQCPPFPRLNKSLVEKNESLPNNDFQLLVDFGGVALLLVGGVVAICFFLGPES